MSDKLIKVVAGRTGYYKNRIRQEGDSFEVEESALASWMLVDGKPFNKKSYKKEEPKKEESKKSKKSEKLSELI